MVCGMTGRALITPRSATLLGIYRGEGTACDACGRELSARQFRCTTADGSLLVLGRRCAARATGYPTTRLEHLAAALERRQAWEREVATSWTVEQLAAHYREVVVTYPDGTLDTWLPAEEGQPARTTRRPVLEVATEELTRLQAQYAN